jgi:hypothetical protein
MDRHIIESLKTIEPINRLLERRFGLRVGPSSVEHLMEVQRHYEEKRRLFLHTMGEAAALQHDGYAKAVLISEAAKIILREIAPKRIKKRRKH